MKTHEFTIYGGQSQNEQGGQEWPDFLSIKVPKSIQLEIIKFLATSLQDEKMEEATINVVGKIAATGEKTQQELFGVAPTPETGGNPNG